MNSNGKNKLDLYSAKEQDHPLNSFYEGEEDFDGLVTKERKCTEIICLIIFILMSLLAALYSYKGSFYSSMKTIYIYSLIIEKNTRFTLYLYVIDYFSD
jgi:hypothetical protein